MNTFYIWTIGCQMNKADTARLSDQLMGLGYRAAQRAEDADIIVLNSCAVRQSAEDKVINKLWNLKAIKRSRSDTAIALTGCMVNANSESLRQRFPHVDFFMRPQTFDELLEFACIHAPVDESPVLISSSEGATTAYVPVIHGCDNFCSYCIVPYRRGREKSRPMAEILCEIQALADQGVKEVTLLGQNVDSYGHDLPGKPDLADLLGEINCIEALARIRFLTSHPKDMRPKIIEAIASLDKVCEHISVPAQSGDNTILEAMRRGYTIEEYKALIGRIRATIPNVALSNDIIVGFPGETSEQFQRTFDFLQEYRFDTVHIAAYSPRPGTTAARKLSDNVSPEEKQKRLQQVEALQEAISSEINTRLVGQTVEILVEMQKAGKWQGRTRTDKLVFFRNPENCRGQLVQVDITSTGPWSMQGVLLVPKESQ